MKWLKPSVKYSSAYSWTLANSQSDNPDFNSANVGTNGILTTSIGFSPSDLVELFYTPKTSKKSSNRRGRSSNKDKDQPTKEITNPTLKAFFENLYSFSDQFSKINVNYIR